MLKTLCKSKHSVLYKGHEFLRR